MHVAVFADLEGSFGIWRMRQCRTGTAEWEYGRACLTADVNHVVDGAFAGGADRVTVFDTHDTGFNCLVHRLDRRARYVGGHHVKPTFFGDVSDVDLALYVAIHARAGTEGAFFPHTHYGIFAEVRINGDLASEMDVYGAYLGEHGVPIGLVSGEEVAVQQAARSLPWARTVAVDKRKETYVGQGAREYLEQGRARLRDEAARACRDVSKMRRLRCEGLVHMEVIFRTDELAARFNRWGLDQQGRVVSWNAPDIIGAFDTLNKVTFFTPRNYPVRRPLLLLLGKYFGLKHAYLRKTPNSEGAPLP